jgi:hypothetical protein
VSLLQGRALESLGTDLLATGPEQRDGVKVRPLPLTPAATGEGDPLHASVEGVLTATTFATWPTAKRDDSAS